MKSKAGEIFSPAFDFLRRDIPLTNPANRRTMKTNLWDYEKEKGVIYLCLPTKKNPHTLQPAVRKY